MKLKYSKVLLPLSIPVMLGLILSSCGKTVNHPLTATGSVQGIDSQPAATLFAKAKSLQAAGKNKAAIKTYAEIADKYPLSTQAPNARFEQASILNAQGDLITSFNTYQKFIAKYNSSALYSTAIQKQSEVALAAAKGDISHNFLGLKSKLAGETVEKMLVQVRDNAPYSAQAPKAQFAIGQIWQEREDKNRAIAGYRGVQERYPDDKLTPEALYRTGEIYLSQAATGNRNKAGLDSAKNVFLDLIQQYPSHPRAKDAKVKIVELKNSDIQRSFDIAEFYLNKEQTASAAFYYREVISKSASGSLREKAQQRLKELGQ